MSPNSGTTSKFYTKYKRPFSGYFEKQSEPSTYFENAINLIEPDALLLIHFGHVDLTNLRVHKEKAKAQDFDEHVLLFRKEVHASFQHVNGQVDHIRQQLFIPVRQKEMKSRLSRT